MINRSQITKLLNQLETDLKELEISYEQYFMGIEKRAPEQQRQKLSLQFHRLLNKYIPQTDLKFRLHGLTSRFHSYSGYWDRVMRLIDEGRYERHTSRLQRNLPSTQTTRESAATSTDTLDALYSQLVKAHNSCSIKAPNRSQVAGFLAKQETVIKEKFGDRQIEFTVITEGGKPKIKVRAKN